VIELIRVDIVRQAVDEFHRSFRDICWRPLSRLSRALCSPQRQLGINATVQNALLLHKAAKTVIFSLLLLVALRLL